MLQIDTDGPPPLRESDVEQKLIMPLLVGEAYLHVPPEAIFTKDYLEPTALDKKASKTAGYYPDYSVWFRSFPVMVVEAKATAVPVEEGYREASLYARHLNQNYPTGLNPCRYLLAANGESVLFGYWDAQPILRISRRDLKIGGAALAELRKHIGREVLEEHARACVQQVRAEVSTRPFNLAGGQPLLASKLRVNSFAAELSPVLRRYFSSANQENNREIALRAYVSTAEVTEYDRVLEALLKDRLNVRRDTPVEPIETTRRGETHIAKAIQQFGEDRPERGQIQIVQGGVGTGKSLFIRRYKEALQSDKQKELTRWAIVDFNSGPTELRGAEDWVCRRFIESIQTENPELDITSNGALRGVFSRNIQSELYPVWLTPS